MDGRRLCKAASIKMMSISLLSLLLLIGQIKLRKIGVKPVLNVQGKEGLQGNDSILESSHCNFKVKKFMRNEFVTYKEAIDRKMIQDY